MIRVFQGDEAFSLLSDPEFRRKWSSLYHDCPYATCFQGVQFITVWYRCYAEKFDPLIVVDGVEQESLRGLMLLAVSKENGKLSVAGTHHAEYQVWLEAEGQLTSFVEPALDRLAEMFPKGQLEFLFLPPGTPLQVSERWGKRFQWRPIPRGLMSTEPGNAIASKLKTQSVKRRLNQLQRAGKLSFERILGPEEFSLALDEVIPFYDFRQGAMYGTLPFAADPQKKQFYLAMMEQIGLLHVTVLRLDGRIVAAQIGPMNKQQVVLGIIAHSPFLSRYSLGRIHILYLGIQLEKERLEAFDLTPGGKYKERFASHHDEAYVLKVFFRRSDAVRYKLQRHAINIAKRFVSTEQIKKVVGLLRHKVRLTSPFALPAKLIRRLRGALWSTRELRIYRFDPSRVKFGASEAIMRRDCLEDLLLYVPSESWQPTLSEFLREAMHRLGGGHHVYTRVLDGRLVHYGWLIERQLECELTEVNQKLTWPPNSAVLYDYYTHPLYRGKGLYKNSLQQMLECAATIPGTEHICISVSQDNIASRHVIEGAGFTYERSLFQRFRFGVTKRW